MSNAMFKNHEGEMEMPVVGEWYLAQHGFDVVTGKCTDICNGGVILKFRWYSPIRRKHFVMSRCILGKTSDPRTLTKLWGLLK